MLQLSENATKLYHLLYTRDFSLEQLMYELASGIYTPEDVSIAGFQYVSDCICDLMDENGQEPCRACGERLPGFYSSHMLEALNCLLEHGLNPNMLYGKDPDQSNIMSELRYVENGYLAADSLALLLDHGGNPSIRINGVSLIRDVNFDLLFDLNNQTNRARYDSLVHYWMVLVGFGAKLEDGGESIDLCPGHNVSELKNHRNFYYGAIESDRSNDHMEICFFSKYTNLEVGRF